MGEKDKQAKQVRNLQTKIEFRKVQDSGNNTATLEGYAVKFNSPTVLWAGYSEQIDPHAFDNTLEDEHNIFLLYAHDDSKPLASTETGTLVLDIDNIGLHFVATVDTSISFVADTVNLIKSGILHGCSFGFYILDDHETYDVVTDMILDTVTRIALLEISILSNPQYADSEVSARAKQRIEEYRSKQKKTKNDKEILELIKLELDSDD